MQNKVIFLLILLFCFSSFIVCEDKPELRGVWIIPRTYSRVDSQIWNKSESTDSQGDNQIWNKSESLDSQMWNKSESTDSRVDSQVWNKSEIAKAMKIIASNHFNTVYFNVWSRGWPLWRSEAFYRETGFYIDPAAGDRDILQDAIVEAKKNGLRLEAWMEYGFVAWWSSDHLPNFPKGPLFAMHPDWLAKNRKGSDQFPCGDGSVFYWMNHNHPDVHQFLISLCREISSKYEVNGIELDRIRYPQLDCGYDEYSVEIYKQEHDGELPPSDPTNPQWKRWRADRLVAFQRAAYDAIKAINSNIIVSNAPSHYASGNAYPAYDNFLQDWRAWLNLNKLDVVQVQMYVKPGALKYYIPSALQGVEDYARHKVFAGIAAKTSSFTLTKEETLELIQIVRESGLQGNSFWYYDDLEELGYFPIIGQKAYPTKVPVPFNLNSPHLGDRYVKK